MSATKDGKRLYLSAAYLVEVEPKTFGLYRDCLLDTRDPRTGRSVTEQLGRPVGPIGLFRECEGSEQPDMLTSHPKDGRPMKLRRLS